MFIYLTLIYSVILFYSVNPVLFCKYENNYKALEHFYRSRGPGSEHFLTGFESDFFPFAK